MTDTFTWPTPPQFISPPSVSTAADKDCLIVLTDGKKLLGKLIRVSPEDSVLEYQPNRDTAVTSLPFASIKNLRLVQPLVQPLVLKK